MTDHPITYREATWNQRRSFDLFEDRVVVRAASFHLDSESTIKLSDLKPDYETLRVRPMIPYRFVVLLGLLAMICLVLAKWFTGPVDRGVLIVMASISTILALSIYALYGNKITFIRFKSRESLPLLDIGRSGPDKRAFESFVSELQERIRSARGTLH